MKRLIGMGDSNKSKQVSKNDSLVNPATKVSHSQIGDAGASLNRFGNHRGSSHEDENDDQEDELSNRSDLDSLRHKEVDRFGFVGGNQYTDPSLGSTMVPIEILRMRELKWLEMVENWDKWMFKRFRKVKERCRKGIPDSLRARAWQLLAGSGATLAANPGRYQSYLDSPGSQTCIDEIKKDVSRQYPNHEMFMEDNGQGQEDLFSVLKAYSVHDPSVGYCQAQGPLAAVLLMLMPAEQAFWTFQAICEKYMPGYYEAGLEAVQIDSMVLFGLLKKASPVAYKHLKKQRVEPILWMTDWFMCLYSRTLPWPSVLRVWDMFLCEGVKVMFRVALVLVKSVLGTSEQVGRCPTFYDTLDLLRKIPAEFMEEKYLAREMAKLQITERDMEKEHERQLKKWNASKAQQHQRNNSSRPPNSPTSKSSEMMARTLDQNPLPSDVTDSSPVDQNGRAEPSDVDEVSSRPSPILPLPGSLLLPKAIATVPSSKPLISLPSSALTVEANSTSNWAQPKPDPTGPAKGQRADEFRNGKALTRFFQASKPKPVDERIKDLAERYRDSSESSRAGSMQTVANQGPFIRFWTGATPSPCSSLSAVPQLADKRRRTFRMSWHKSKASKSTTHIDQ